MWMGNNSNFMEEKIQPILDHSGANINAKVEYFDQMLVR